MDTFLLRMFQMQVVLQCEALLTAAAEIETAVQARTTDHRLWIAVQNLLNAAANLSKAFFGQGGRLYDERRALRESLNVSDDSPLRDPDMRNNFEHYDERLDTWWAESSRHNYFDMSLVDVGRMYGLDAIDMFRVLDPSTGDLVFWGQPFSLPKIISEAERILPLARAEADKPHYDPSSRSGGGQ